MGIQRGVGGAEYGCIFIPSKASDWQDLTPSLTRRAVKGPLGLYEVQVLTV
jgi:hypothetical protein